MIAPVRFLLDEDIDPDVASGLRRRVAGIDVVRVQDVGLRSLPDPVVLEAAANSGRVLLTHDRSTMPL